MATSGTVRLSLEGLESLLAEVTEYYGRYEKHLQKLHRLGRGSEPYRKALAELEVAAEVLRTKAEHASLAIDDYVESLPD